MHVKIILYQKWTYTRTLQSCSLWSDLIYGFGSYLFVILTANRSRCRWRSASSTASFSAIGLSDVVEEEGQNSVSVRP